MKITELSVFPSVKTLSLLVPFTLPFLYLQYNFYVWDKLMTSIYHHKKSPRNNACLSFLFFHLFCCVRILRCYDVADILMPITTTGNILFPSTPIKTNKYSISHMYSLLTTKIKKNKATLFSHSINIALVHFKYRFWDNK